MSIKRYTIIFILALVIGIPLFPFDIDCFTDRGFGFEYKNTYLYNLQAFLNDFPTYINMKEEANRDNELILQIEYESFYVIYRISKNYQQISYLFRSVWAKENNYYYGIYIGLDYLDLARLLNIEIKENQRKFIYHSKKSHDITIAISEKGKVEGIYWDYSLE